MSSRPSCACRSGQIYPSSERNSEIKNFYFLVLPKSNMLDFSAAIEPLRIANELRDETFYRWSLISETGYPVACSNGISVPVDAGLLDTGRNDCVVVCSGSSGYLDASPKTLHWLRFHQRRGGAVAAVASGAFTLARAGLTGLAELSLHWSLRPIFEEMFPEIEVGETTFFATERVKTSAGGASSLDMALSILQGDLDKDTARKVSELCIHDFDPEEPRMQRQPISQRINCRNTTILRIVQRMEKSLHDPVSLDEILEEEDVSRRQVERLFNRFLKTSPSKYYRDIRLDRARSLLRGTHMSVIAVAIAVGFSGSNHFSKIYRRRFGELPGRARAERAGAGQSQRAFSASILPGLSQ